MNEAKPRPRILVVDDVPANVKVLGQALRAEYEIQVALNGEDALRIARSELPPELILLDIMMPGMSGYEVCQRLKAEPRTAATPVIFITARDGENDETKGFDLGAVDYITKPFRAPVVQARVRTHLELKRTRDELERMSQLDGLTGVPNRRRFDAEFPRAFTDALRHEEPLSVLMADIDHFKLYNDHYGHLQGDDCIQRVALAMTRAVSCPAGMVARYGGEEFVIVLPRTDHDGAHAVGERMRDELRNEALPHAKSLVGSLVTLSIGCATLDPERDQKPSALTERADCALYRAKQSGRDRVSS